MRARRLALALLLAAAGPLRATPQLEPAETFTVDDPRGRAPAGVRALVSPAVESGVALGAVPQVVLPALDAARLQAEDEALRRVASEKVLRYGVGRAVALAARDGAWTELADGRRLWVAEVGSAGALAIRLHFADVRLPAGARLAVVPTDAAAGEPWDARPDRDEAWSPSLAGEAVRVEYLAPSGAAAALPFRVDRLQHVYVDPVRALAGQSVFGQAAAGACNNDAACHPEWGREARAVAGVGIVGGDSLFCTGQLLNDVAQDYTPYFLTAHHCVSTAREAASAEFYWFYQTPSCGGLPPTLATVPRSAGAVLLSTAVQSDHALLRVEGRLPRGVAWAGWTAKPVPDGTPVAVIHHPQGDYKRISFGAKGSQLECGGAQHVRVRWTDGPTEPGSSGSGAYRADTHQLLGQLHCGPSACGEETYDQFGAFAAAYARLRPFLAQGDDDVEEPNDACRAARPVKPGVHAGLVVRYRNPDWYRLRVPAGRTLRVTLRYAGQEGAVTTQAVSACGRAAKAKITSGRGVKVLQLANAGADATYSWKVDLPDDLRASYAMTVELR